MLLAVNVNNTHATFGVYDGARSVGAWRVRTNPIRTADSFARPDDAPRHGATVTLPR